MVHKQEIIISHFKQKKGLRWISRETGLHRKTVTAYINEYKATRSNEDLMDEGVIEPPEYNSSNRKSIKLTDEIKKLLIGYIDLNEQKSKQLKHKQLMTAKDMHEQIKAAGHSIGYTTVSTFVTSILTRRKERYIKQSHAAGRSAEFDWGEVKLNISGVAVKLQLAVFSLPHSNYRFVQLYARQDMSAFLKTHVDFLSHIDGVPSEIVYDNAKTAVARFSYDRLQKVATTDLLRLSTYYLYEIRFCNAYKGNEKGHVEGSVKYVRRKAFCLKDSFDSIQQANEYLSEQLIQINNSTSKGQQITQSQRFKIEQTQLTPLPNAPFDSSIIRPCSITKYSTIQIDTNHYSIPDTYNKDRVQVKISPYYIRIFDDKSTLIAQHDRSILKHQWMIQLKHFHYSLLQKPGALKHSIALSQAAPAIKQLFEKYFIKQPKEFIQVLGYGQENSISHDLIIQTIEHLHQKAPHHILTFDWIKCQLEAQLHKTNTPKEPSEKGAHSSDIENQCMAQLLAAQSTLQ